MTADEIKALQSRLAALGYAPGPVDGDYGPRTKAAVIAFQRDHWLVPDGIVGPKTRAALDAASRPISGAPAVTLDRLKKIAPYGRKDIFEALVDRMATTGVEFEITTHPLRLCHFIAQCAQESDGFRTTREYWGPTIAQKRYEGRADLGNTHEGDGKRYMGRGIFMLTGRANYTRWGERVGLALADDPELAAVPSTSTLIACHYWRDRGCDIDADIDNLKAVTRKINGGLNGLDDRAAYLAKAKGVWM